MTVNQYITQNWVKTLREAGSTGAAGIGNTKSIPLPKPFNVPSLDDRFNNLFYWDTYLLNLGLLVDGMFGQAKNNLENMAYLIDVLGFMPNSNRLIYHSQPPLFTRGVYDLYLYTKDKTIVAPFLNAMKKEHAFFMQERNTELNLNRYGCSLADAELKKFYPYFSERLKMRFEVESEQNAFTRNMFAICESGWDSTSRFNRNGKRFATNEFIPIDLNCILYDMECKIAEISSWTGDKESEERYRRYATERKALINEYLLDKKTGLYYDYNFVLKEFSQVFSAASFFPYAFGISSDENGVKKALQKLELGNGISSCEKLDFVGLQWDYPLMWPSNVWAAFVALEKCGLKEDAKRIAVKYIDSVDKTFEETGTLWEKYDAITGYMGQSKQEGNASPMLGWTAGVYKYLKGGAL